MGCDIHIEVEKKVDDRWEIVDPADWGYGPTERDDWIRWDGVYHGKPDPITRSYATFSFLTGVRGGDYVPAFPDRGWPKDTAVTMEEPHDIGDHSFTYATLAELLALAWPPQIENHDFREWCEEILTQIGHPDSVRVLLSFDN